MIRDNYMSDMKSKEMRVRQRAVAMYFIDKLALRYPRPVQRTGSPIGDLSRNYASFAKLVAFKSSFCIQSRLFEKI